MNYVVLLKQTFDTEEKIQINNGQIVEDGVEFIMNPYDEYATEEAIRLKEAHGGEVIVVALGPDRTESAIRTALALGADRAILIDDPALFGDEHQTAQVLAAVVKDLNADIILGGNVAVDSGAGQVAVRVAELLGINHIATITKIEVNGSTVTVERDVEGDLEVIEASLPVLVTAQQGLNEPRYPSLPNIMKAKKKPLDRLGASDVTASFTGSKTKVVEQYLPPKKEAGKILTGDVASQVTELVQLLKTEAKVI